VPRLCEFYPAICLTTEKKAWKNLSQGKKNLSQVKKNLSQSTVHILPPQKTRTHTDTHTHTRVHTFTRTLSQHTHSHSHVRAHTHTCACTLSHTLTHTHSLQNLSLPAPYFWLFLWRLSAPHRFAPRVAHPLDQPWMCKWKSSVWHLEDQTAYTLEHKGNIPKCQ